MTNAFPILSKEEERRLVRRAKAGESAAKEELFARYEGLMKRAAHQAYLGSEELRHDALSIAQLAFLTAIHTYDDSADTYFAAYAKMRVEGALYAEFRRTKKRWLREIHPDAAEDAAAFWDALSPAATPEDDALNRLMLKRAVRVLTPREKEILRRIYYENETLAEVAAHLHRTRQAVGKAKKKILSKLRTFFKDGHFSSYAPALN